MKNNSSGYPHLTLANSYSRKEKMEEKFEVSDFKHNFPKT
jgi:hypothetical protein